MTQRALLPVRSRHRLARGALLALLPLLLGAQGGLPAADDPPPPGLNLPRPVASLRDRTASGLPVRLDLYTEGGPPALVAFRLLEASSPAHPAPTLEEEGHLLDRLLGQLAAMPGLPPAFRFAPDHNPLVAALNRRLVQPDANWDARRGIARHGGTGDALRTELAGVLAASPAEAAFEAHGYRLTLNGIARIEMADGRGHTAKLPAYISEMDVTATRTGATGGAGK